MVENGKRNKVRSVGEGGASNKEGGGSKKFLVGTKDWSPRGYGVRDISTWEMNKEEGVGSGDGGRAIG